MRISNLLSTLLGFSGAFQLRADEGDTGGNAPDNRQAAPKESFSREYVSELREENKSWRLKISERDTELSTLKAKVAELETGGKDALTKAEQAANDRVLRAELKAVAAKHGAVDVADALKVLDISGVKLDENGNLVGADELFESAKKAKPYLFGTTNTSSTEKPPKPGDTKPVDVRTADAKDYEAQKAAYLKASR
jgi:outer membrane murein-binding lipoprotein Lpp